jgi:hypothetical protein
VGLLGRLDALDDRFWVKRQTSVRVARRVAFGISAIGLVLVLLGFRLGLTELGLALFAGVGAVVLAASANGWVARRRLAKPRP